MSPRLDVVLDPGPLERVRCELAVIFFFESDRPLRGGAGRADWRLCGQLSELLRDDRLRGAPGEAVLIPTGGGLAAPRLLGLGLGARNRFGAEACTALGREAVARAAGLRVASAALQIPDPEAGDLELSERLDTLIHGAAAALAGGAASLRLHLVPGPAELAPARAALSALALRPPLGVELRVAPERPPRSADPLGAGGLPPLQPQSIK